MAEQCRCDISVKFHFTELAPCRPSRAAGLSREHVLLQTADGYITGQKEREEQWINILLDSGS